MSKQKPLMFPGVPLVRVIKVGKRWQVQERETEESEQWSDIGPTWSTADEALDQAPVLCEF